MLKEELKKSFMNPFNILIVLIIPIAWYLGTGAMRHNFEFLQNAALSNEYFKNQFEKFSGYTFFAEGVSSFYISLFAVLLSGIAYSSQFAYDKNSGLGNFIITRSGFNKYFRVKVFVTSFVPFFTVTLSILIAFVYSLIVYSSNDPIHTFSFIMNGDSDLVKFFLKTPMLACMLMIFSISFTASIYSLIGMCSSAITSNRFIVSLVPFALYIACTLVPQFFLPNTTTAKCVAWVFPTYFTGIFTNSEIWYSDLSEVYIYLIHIIVLLIPTVVLVLVLYFKNKKQYVK